MKSRANAAILTLLIAVAISAIGAGSAVAQTDVTVDPAEIVLGYMNVFDLGGGFQFGSGWGLPDLTANFAGSILTLGPNSIGDPDPYWYIGGGGPGAAGNKIMEANCYAEDAGALTGQTVTFNGEVLATSLTGAHTVTAFVKDYAPDFSSFVESAVVLSAAGPFSVTLATINDPARHIQYGFQMTGVNVWVTDVAQYGTLVVGPYTPVAVENASWGEIKSLYR